MLRLLALAPVLLLLARCGGPRATAPPPADMPAPNADGWVSLFDGRTLAGWHGFNRQGTPAGWRVEDGALHFAPGGEGGDLVTDAAYDDFELELEWKVAPCGNSGVFYRGAEGAGPDGQPYDAVWRTALEMQVLDDACHPDARFPSHTAGALYDLYTPREKTARPAGEWNRVRIVARGAHLEHWLNGVKIVEAEQGSPGWDARVAASKFRTIPGYGTLRRGVIALQDHGDRVWYRNLRLRPLS